MNKVLKGTAQVVGVMSLAAACTAGLVLLASVIQPEAPTATQTTATERVDSAELKKVADKLDPADNIVWRVAELGTTPNGKSVYGAAYKAGIVYQSGRGFSQDTILIDPQALMSYTTFYGVAAHEFGHIAQYKYYGDSFFHYDDHGPGVADEREVEADCIGRYLGGTSHAYTEKCSATQLDKAKTIVDNYYEEQNR